MKKIFITGVLSLLSCFKIFAPDEANALVSESTMVEPIILNEAKHKDDQKSSGIEPEKATSKEVAADVQSEDDIHIPPTAASNSHEITWDSIMSVIKKSESLQLDPYVCPAGYWTVGYGHLITSQDQYLMNGITKKQADSLLRKDLGYCENFVKKHLKLKGNQLKAISLFCFAFGSAKLYRSTMYKKIKAGEPIDDEIVKWCKLNGRKSKRLLKARQLELALYNSGN